MGQYTCPKCSGKNWKTKLKRRAWECRTCGYIKKEITQEEEDLLMDLEREKIIIEPKAVIPPKIKKEIPKVEIKIKEIHFERWYEKLYQWILRKVAKKTK